MKRHWPVLALGAVSMTAAFVVFFWRLAGGPNTYPLAPFLALMGTITLSLWQRLVQRERKRFIENWSRNRLTAHQRKELNDRLFSVDRSDRTP